MGISRSAFLRRAGVALAEMALSGTSPVLEVRDGPLTENDIQATNYHFDSNRGTPKITYLCDATPSDHPCVWWGMVRIRPHHSCSSARPTASQSYPEPSLRQEY